MMRCVAHNLLAALALASCLVLGAGSAATVAEDTVIPFAATPEMQAAVENAAKKGQQKYEEEEASLQRMLEHSPPTKEAVDAMARDLPRAQKQLRAQEIALALQPFFETFMRAQNYAEAQGVAEWQFSLMKRAFSNYLALPDFEYSSTPKELIPYYKNLGRLYTALQDWDMAATNFGIEFRVTPEEGMAQALCTGAALAAERGEDHNDALAYALLPFVKKAYEAKEWDRAEALALWQVHLQESVGRYQLGGHDTSTLSDYYYNLGIIAKSRGSTYNAKEYFEKSLKPSYNSKSRVDTANKILPALELAQLEKAAQNPAMVHMHSSQAWAFMLTMPTINISQGNDALQLLIWSLTAQGLYGEALQQASVLIDFLENAKMQNTPQMAQALYTLGNVHKLLGDNHTAQQNYMAALDIYKQDATSHPSEQADLLTELAHGCRAQGQDAQAVALLKEAVVLYARQPASSLEGAPACDQIAANLLRGQCYLRLGQYEKAIDALQLAYIEHVSRLNNPLAEQSSFLLMQAYASQGLPHAAIFWGKHAVNALQEIRADVQRASVDIQRTFIHSKKEVYYTLIDLLHTQGRILEAEHVYSLLKTAELRQFTPEEAFGRASGQPVPFVGIEESLDTLLLDCVTTLNAFTYGVDTVRHWDDRVEYPLFHNNQKPIVLMHMGVVSFADGKPRYLENKNKELMREMLRSQAPGLEYNRNYPESIIISPESLPSLQRRLEMEKDILRAFVQALPRTLAEKSPPAGQGYLQKAVRNLDEGTVLLHAVSTANTLWLWISGPGGKTLSVRSVAMPRHILAQHVQELRAIVTERKLDPRPAAKKLYDILFAPVEKELQKIGPKTILFSLDGTLRYIPPAILYDGTQWLVERYALGLFLEASKDCLSQRPPHDWSIGGVGLTEAIGDFAPLPGVERELKNIVRSTSNTHGLIPGKIYLNKDFTEQSLLSILDEKMSILHVATHFKLNPTSASESFLLLGDGTQLPLTHLADEKFSFKALQQITLSACETGLSLTSSGSEIESLGALVQKKGAQSVLATLWSISDASTSLVMPIFYENIVNKRLPRAEALRQAQLALLKGPLNRAGDQTPRGGEAPPLRRRDMPGYSHPYYWGAFILMGNWQ